MVAPDAKARSSAVIVNFNARPHLVECVRSLRADGVDQIVVVDNASSDGSEAALAESDPDSRFLPTGSNLGFGTAANVGVANTASAYVLVLNPDTILQPGTTKALAAALDRDPRMAVGRTAGRQPRRQPVPVGPPLPEDDRRRRPRLPGHGVAGQPLHRAATACSTGTTPGPVPSTG